ncbi:MAG: VOC family protein [Pseudomonadota bacterium]|nr:VOC family protein [Pseudomonadota bacterium]
MSIAVDWFEIPVKDVARAKAFYEAVLDTQMQTMSDGTTEMVAFVGDEGPAGCLTTEDSSPMAGGVLVYLSCENIQRALQQVTANGGTVMQQETDIGPHGYCAQFTDTEGNLVALHRFK